MLCGLCIRSALNTDNGSCLLNCSAEISSIKNSHANSLFPSILGISQSDAELSVLELNNENI